MEYFDSFDFLMRILEILTGTTVYSDVRQGVMSVIAAFIAIIALVNCFFGFKLLKLWLAFCGFLAGCVVALILIAIIVEFTGLHPAGGAVLFILVCAVIGAIVAYKVYKIGLFIMGGGAAMLFCLICTIVLLFPEYDDDAIIVAAVMSVIMFIIVGILTVKLARLYVILSTGIVGGLVAGNAVLTVFNVSGRGPAFLLGGVFAILGIMYQFHSNKTLPATDNGKNEHVKDRFQSDKPLPAAEYEKNRHIRHDKHSIIAMVAAFCIIALNLWYIIQAFEYRPYGMFWNIISCISPALLTAIAFWIKFKTSGNKTILIFAGICISICHIVSVIIINNNYGILFQVNLQSVNIWSLIFFFPMTILFIIERLKPYRKGLFAVNVGLFSTGLISYTAATVIYYRDWFDAIAAIYVLNIAYRIICLVFIATLYKEKKPSVNGTGRADIDEATEIQSDSSSIAPDADESQPPEHHEAVEDMRVPPQVVDEPDTDNVAPAVTVAPIAASARTVNQNLTLNAVLEKLRIIEDRILEGLKIFFDVAERTAAKAKNVLEIKIQERRLYNEQRITVCPACGKQCPREDKFCPACGTALQKSENKANA
jgi:rubrerythrin